MRAPTSSRTYFCHHRTSSSLGWFRGALGAGCEGQERKFESHDPQSLATLNIKQQTTARLQRPIRQLPTVKLFRATLQNRRNGERKGRDCRSVCVPLSNRACRSDALVTKLGGYYFVSPCALLTVVFGIRETAWTCLAKKKNSCSN